MRTIILFFLLTTAIGAQQIAPRQIKPAPVDGQVLTTQGGVVLWGAAGGSTVAGVTFTGPCSSGSVLIATSATAGTCRAITADDIQAGFSITGFGCSTCGGYEIGQTIASPTNITASYSSTPTGASLTDGTHTVALANPYTSASLPYSYTSSVQGGVTFTLTAAGAVSKSASAGIGWYPRTFAGVGSPGATGASASGSSAVLTAATGTLASAGLNNQGSYGSFSPSNQKVYVLMIGCGHTFTAAGFNFPMLTPTSFTFTNQYGASVPMCLYESTNLLSAPLTLNLAS